MIGCEITCSADGCRYIGSTVRRALLPAIAAALLSACAANPAPAPPHAREVAYLQAVQAQAARIAAMTDEEVAKLNEQMEHSHG